MTLMVHRNGAAKSVRKPRRKPEPVETLRVDRDAWRRAQEILASGSYTRIEIVSKDEVVVR